MSWQQYVDALKEPGFAAGVIVSSLNLALCAQFGLTNAEGLTKEEKALITKRWDQLDSFHFNGTNWKFIRNLPDEAVAKNDAFHDDEEDFETQTLFMFKLHSVYILAIIPQSTNFYDAEEAIGALKDALKNAGA